MGSREVDIQPATACPGTLTVAPRCSTRRQQVKRPRGQRPPVRPGETSLWGREPLSCPARIAAMGAWRQVTHAQLTGTCEG